MKHDAVDKCLDIGVSVVFSWIEAHVPLPFRILTKPIEYLIRRRIKKKLEKLFANSKSEAGARVVNKLQSGLRPSLQDYKEAVNGN